MALALRLIPQNTSVNFTGASKLAATCSALLMVGLIALLATRGMNFGIDFAGGVLVEIRTEQDADLAQLRPLFADPDYGETSLQHFGDKREVLIRLEGNSEIEQAVIVERVKASLRDALGDDVTFRRVDYVGPTIGTEMLQSGALALICAFGGMLLYIWIRFEWQFGIGALLALVHDAIFVLGFYAVTGNEFGLSAIAAILTVIGYSINDSVVIFDRIRENMRRFNNKPLDEIVNLSLNQTLSRTILTAITTLLAAGALAWLGGEIIRGFALALCVGVFVGTYSSIYVAAPALKLFHLSRDAFDIEAEPQT